MHAELTDTKAWPQEGSVIRHLVITIAQLRAARALLGLSQAEFAALLHISAASVMRWEAGEPAAVPRTRADVLADIESRLRDVGITFGLELGGTLVVRFMPPKLRNAKRGGGGRKGGGGGGITAAGRRR